MPLNLQFSLKYTENRHIIASRIDHQASYFPPRNVN